MYDQAFTKRTLEKMIKNSDYYRERDLVLEKDSIVAESYKKVFDAQTNDAIVIELSTNKIKKKNKVKYIYRLKKLVDKILVRKITKNIKVVTGVKQENRDSVVRNIKTLFAEGVQYRIYRKDIKDFYGAISVSSVISELDADFRVSRPTLRLIKNILDNFDLKRGLPRGLQISATLAEYAMIKFDEAIRRHPDVFFFSRFVDDILIITSGDEDENQFECLLEKNLPFGLVFNLSKDKEYKKLVRKIYNNESPPALEAAFDFLGYEIKLYNPKTVNDDAKKTVIRRIFKEPRKITFEISNKKVKKFKTRVIKALLSYLEDKDFELLYDRIKVLTGNYYIFDRDRNTKQTAGIYFSYKHVTVNPDDSTSSVKALDKFLLNMVLSGKGRISKKLKLKLNKTQQRVILKQTFSNGFKSKVIHHFHVNRMIEIARCWNHD